MKSKAALFSFLILISASFVARSEVSGEIPKNPDDSLLDTKTDPCENFYQYSCGGWLAKTEIPADKPNWERGFTDIAERNKKVLKQILESFASGKRDTQNPYSKQLGDFYASCVNEDNLDKGSLKTLQLGLSRIDSITKNSLPSWLAWAHLRGVNPFFSFVPNQDLKKPENVIAEIGQAGMGLPAKDYYFDDSEQGKAVRQKYLGYISNLLSFSGMSKADSEKNATKILELETKLAKKALAPVDFRQPENLYHVLDLATLKKTAPAFDWDKYLKALTSNKIASVNIQAPVYLQEVNELLKETPLSDLKIYFKFHLINASAKGLSNRFYSEYFDFYAKTFYGLKEMSARWKRCADASDEMMGFALGRSFVNQTFAGASKDIARDMIERIEKAQGAVIEGVSWMDEKTKMEAKEKLARLVNQIGYPDNWRKYDGVQIKKGSYLSNRYELIAFNSKYELSKIGKPLNRVDWTMSPSVVNAYYEPLMNKMVFPAGILQPPFFSESYSAAANYGGIGMVMGHEISHGYDDQGRQFNGLGAMFNWWTEDSLKGFNKQASCLSKQYESYPTAGGGHVDGSLTLGEDIGDQGGLKSAYLAWKGTLKKEITDDSTALRNEEKKFFQSFAQAWCGKDTDAFEQTRVKTDPHPPNRYRVNGALSNFSEFGKAFQCKENSKMAPKNKCVVW